MSKIKPWCQCLSSVLILSFVVIFPLNSFSEEEKTLTVSSTDSSSHSFSVDDLQNRLSLHVIQVNDPVYNAHKKYAGFWLSDIFKLAGVHVHPTDEIIFSALDGYQAHLLVKDMLSSKARAFVAIKDVEVLQGWEKIKQGKEMVSPAPFYLVWQSQTKLEASGKLPWPYQIASITVQKVDFGQKSFPEAEGKTDAIKRGFKTFQQNCLSCHSINLEGGVIGPELNVPKNILEYRDRKMLIEFIKDPSSFRAKDKMPGFGTLSEVEINELLDYLAWMGQHKLKDEQ